MIPEQILTLQHRISLADDELAFQQIFRLFYKGLLQFSTSMVKSKEVAEELQISGGTVRKHVQNIYKKLQVNTRVEAVNLYLKR